ncbi:MAG TPA: AraC family transcriptional regulator [Candidatus Acidoferrales bacterium]|nr:AraC family transcriptional regulator [Candidatus Acidoferrales bacterium]
MCAVSLLPGALDAADQQIFDDEVITGLRLPDLKRSLTIEDDDRFDSFVFEVFDYVSQASLRRSAPSQHAAFRMQRMKRFIERHAFEELTLTDIAACLGISPFTCIRQFKRAMGTTPLQYLSRLRLQRAQALLKNPRPTIAEVARTVGIPDRHYFSRWFSKATGVPPERFRRIASR